MRCIFYSLLLHDQELFTYLGPNHPQAPELLLLVLRDVIGEEPLDFADNNGLLFFVAISRFFCSSIIIVIVFLTEHAKPSPNSLLSKFPSTYLNKYF